MSAPPAPSPLALATPGEAAGGAPAQAAAGPARRAGGTARAGRGWKGWVLCAHRWAGVLTGLFLTVTAGTGLVLLWTDELNLRARPAVATWEALGPVERALPEIAAALPGYALTSVRADPDPRRAWTVFLRHPETDRRVAAELDPGTGRVLGLPDYHGTPFRWLLDLHYMYGAKAAGQVLATLTAAALVFLAVSGVILYCPHPRELFRWRFDPRRPLAGAVWLHKWAGLWALALAFVWGTTALLLMASILPNTFAAAPDRFVAADPAQLARLAPFAPMVAEARRQFPEAELLNLVPPRADVVEDTAVTRVVLLFRDAAPWDKFGELRFGAFDGVLREVTPPHARSFEQRLDAAVATLHYGNLGRPVWQWLYLAGGLFLLSLPLSGYVIWLGKRRARPARA